MRIVKEFTDFLQTVSVGNSAERCDLCYMPGNNPQQWIKRTLGARVVITNEMRAL